jgi:hypothetical protein
MPRELKPNLSEELERVLLKALAKNPGDRFQNVNDMLLAMQAALSIGGEGSLDQTVVTRTIVAPPPAEPPRVRLTEPPRVRLTEPQIFLTTEVLVSKVDATRAVSKTLKGILRRKEHINENAPKVWLPLWRVQAELKRGMSRRPTDKYMYFDTHYGKLMTVDSKAMRFTDIVAINPRQVSDLDGRARFTREPIDQLAVRSFKPRVSQTQIMEMARDMFGTDIVGAEVVMLPMWEFTLIHRDTGQARQVLVDTTFGLVVEGKTQVIKDTHEPPPIVEPTL